MTQVVFDKDCDTSELSTTQNARVYTILFIEEELQAK